MDEKVKNKIEFMAQQLSRLKNIAHSQQVIIENLAKVQIEMESEHDDSFSDKIGAAFSNASKNQDLLHNTIQDYEIELNQLRNQ